MRTVIGGYHLRQNMISKERSMVQNIYVSHLFRTRRSIATHIHSTISNVGSQANRPSHRIIASCIPNSRVNNNRSHRLCHACQLNAPNSKVNLTFRRFAARFQWLAISSIIMDLQISTKILEDGCKPAQLVQRKVSDPPSHPD